MRCERLIPSRLAEMNPVTAARLGLEDGCRVIVETEHGQAQLCAQNGAICVKMSSVWSTVGGFRRMPACEPELGGMWLSNANLLTSAEIQDIGSN